MKISFKDVEKYLRENMDDGTADAFKKNHFTFYRMYWEMEKEKIKRRYGKKIFRSYCIALGNAFDMTNSEEGYRFWCKVFDMFMKMDKKLDRENTEQLCRMIKK